MATFEDGSQAVSASYRNVLWSYNDSSRCCKSCRTQRRSSTPPQWNGDVQVLRTSARRYRFLREMCLHIKDTGMSLYYRKRVMVLPIYHILLYTSEGTNNRWLYALTVAATQSSTDMCRGVAKTMSWYYTVSELLYCCRGRRTRITSWPPRHWKPHGQGLRTVARRSPTEWGLAAQRVLMTSVLSWQLLPAASTSSQTLASK